MAGQEATMILYGAIGLWEPGRAYVRRCVSCYWLAIIYLRNTHIDVSIFEALQAGKVDMYFTLLPGR